MKDYFSLAFEWQLDTHREKQYLRILLATIYLMEANYINVDDVNLCIAEMKPDTM